jgi:putative resolvase
VFFPCSQAVCFGGRLLTELPETLELTSITINVINIFMAKRLIKLSAWAKLNGVSKLTAWRRASEGMIPGARQNPSGHYVVEIDDPEPEKTTAIYARVSSHDQRSDLDRQIARLAVYAAQSGMAVGKVVSEIGSGLNGRRRELARLLADPTVGTILVEHRDRLARFGVEHLQAAFAATGRKIIIVDEGEVEDDLARDLIELMTCFSARLYGRRSAANRARRALEALKP